MLTDLNQNAMSYELTMFFRQFWNDTRLSFDGDIADDVNDHTCVDASFAEKIWRPDLYFVDSREQRRHDVVTDNLFMEVKAQFD